MFIVKKKQEMKPKVIQNPQKEIKIGDVILYLRLYGIDVILQNVQCFGGRFLVDGRRETAGGELIEEVEAGHGLALLHTVTDVELVPADNAGPLRLGHAAQHRHLGPNRRGQNHQLSMALPRLNGRFRDRGAWCRMRF